MNNLSTMAILYGNIWYMEKLIYVVISISVVNIYLLSNIIWIVIADESKKYKLLKQVSERLRNDNIDNN